MNLKKNIKDGAGGVGEIFPGSLPISCCGFWMPRGHKAPQRMLKPGGGSLLLEQPLEGGRDHTPAPLSPSENTVGPACRNDLLRRALRL